jgi:hypothetical protein
VIHVLEAVIVAPVQLLVLQEQALVLPVQSLVLPEQSLVLPEQSLVLKEQGLKLVTSGQEALKKTLVHSIKEAPLNVLLHSPNVRPVPAVVRLETVVVVLATAVVLLEVARLVQVEHVAARVAVIVLCQVFLDTVVRMQQVMMVHILDTI